MSKSGFQTVITRYLHKKLKNVAVAFMRHKIYKEEV